MIRRNLLVAIAVLCLILTYRDGFASGQSEKQTSLANTSMQYNTPPASIKTSIDDYLGYSLIYMARQSPVPVNILFLSKEFGSELPSSAGFVITPGKYKLGELLQKYAAAFPQISYTYGRNCVHITVATDPGLANPLMKKVDTQAKSL